MLLHQSPHRRRRIRKLSLSQIPDIQRNLILKTETQPFGSLRALPQPLPNGHLPSAVLQILREWPLRRRSIMRGKQRPRRRIPRTLTPQSIRIRNPARVPPSTTRRQRNHHQSLLRTPLKRALILENFRATSPAVWRRAGLRGTPLPLRVGQGRDVEWDRRPAAERLQRRACSGPMYLVRSSSAWPRSHASSGLMGWPHRQQFMVPAWTSGMNARRNAWCADPYPRWLLLPLAFSASAWCVGQKLPTATAGHPGLAHIFLARAISPRCCPGC